MTKQEKLEITEEDLDSKLAATAEKFGKSLEEYKKSLTENNIAYIKNDILMDKLVDFLTKNNTIA